MLIKASMKQKAFLCIFILISGNIFADTFDDFRKLSADKKIQKILEEYRYDKNWSRHLQFAKFASILTENPKKNIPVLFKYLEKTDMLPLSENDYGFTIIESILTRKFYVEEKILSKNELDRWCAILYQKIADYLEKYKVIDLVIVLAEAQIESIKNNRNIILQPDIGQILYEKYTKSGYTDLQLVYEPIPLGR